MRSPISPATHKTYKLFYLHEAHALVRLMGQFKEQSKIVKPLYHEEAYRRHTDVNIAILNEGIADSLHQRVKVPADILFWTMRSCAHFKIKSKVLLPHICKLEINGVEQFFVASKQDWLAHKNATYKVVKEFVYTDHAKLNYMERVLGVDVDSLMKDAPTDSLVELAKSGKMLNDGRVAVEHEGHLYLLSNQVCVSVLDASMQVE